MASCAVRTVLVGVPVIVRISEHNGKVGGGLFSFLVDRDYSSFDSSKNFKVQLGPVPNPALLVNVEHIFRPDCYFQGVSAKRGWFRAGVAVLGKGQEICVVCERCSLESQKFTSSVSLHRP